MSGPNLRRRRSAIFSALAVGLCLSAGALAACGSSDDSGGESSTAAKADDGGPITIGFATSKSGWLSVYDEPAVTAAEIVRDRINADGGIDGRKVKFVQANAKSDPNASAEAALSVINKGADFVVATCDYDAGAPAARVAQSKGLVSISPCASAPAWNDIGNLSYSMSMGSITEAAVLAQWSYQNNDCQTGYLLTDTSIEYTKAIADYIEKYFEGEIVGKDTFKNDDSSFGGQISRLNTQSPKPDCIFMLSYPPGGVTLVRQLRAAGIDQPLIAPDTMDGDFWIDAIPNLSDFYIAAYASLFGDDPNPEVNEMFDEIERRQGEKVTGSTALGGASIMETLERAIERAGTIDSEKVAAEIAAFEDEELSIGPTTFGEDVRMSLGRPMAIIEVQDGKFSFVERFRPDLDATVNGS